MKGSQMIRFTEEGGKIENGFNFYPLENKSSIGFRLRIGRRYLMVRYSKQAKRFFFRYYKLSEQIVD